MKLESTTSCEMGSFITYPDNGVGMAEEETADTVESEYNKGRKDAVSSGTKVRAKFKRGTDTRDQDVMVIEGRGENAQEAAEDFEAALSRAEENDWADRLRDIQP